MLAQPIRPHLALPRLAAGDGLQSGHGASESGEAAGALALDEGFEGLANEGGLLFDAGELLGGADEVVIEGDGGSHRHGL
jgi:hypothetical protein